MFQQLSIDRPLQQSRQSRPIYVAFRRTILHLDEPENHTWRSVEEKRWEFLGRDLLLLRELPFRRDLRRWVNWC